MATDTSFWPVATGADLDSFEQPMDLSARFPWGERTYVMGVLNVTPDSFSGDGLHIAGRETVAVACDQARAFLAAGADVIDVGGESTRPGAEAVDAATEIARVVPVIEAVRAAAPDAVISIDTSKAAVADEALSAGAAIINDVWALEADPALGPLAAERGAPVILMHNRSRSDRLQADARLGGSYGGAAYDDVVADVAAALTERADAAQAAGIPRDRIMLDPGLGFGKSVNQNLALINELDRLKALGYPVLLGPSRKSFIGRALDLPVDQRLEGTAAAVALGIVRGADMIRVHDVQAMVRVARMMDAMLQSKAVEDLSSSGGDR